MVRPARDGAALGRLAESPLAAWTHAIIRRASDDTAVAADQGQTQRQAVADRLSRGGFPQVGWAITRARRGFRNRLSRQLRYGTRAIGARGRTALSVGRCREREQHEDGKDAD